MCQVPASTVGDYLSGRHLPATAQLIRVLQACGIRDGDEVARWEAALERTRRAGGRRTGRPPYRGLARFEREDAPWFFGREEAVERLTKLATEPSTLPLMLVGTSGAGKSSLLRAGLLPRLKVQADAGLGGPAAVYEPTTAPLPGLKKVLAELADLAGPEDIGIRPTLIIDQFEQIFTLCPDEDQRYEFIAQICDTARSSLVIISLRADFYSHAVRYPTLAAAAQERQILLGAMTSEQLRRAIVEPARRERIDVEDGLTELLLADLGSREAPHKGAYEPGALPLLSHALQVTWEHSRGGRMTTADYLANGGVRQAIARTAEEAYSMLPPGQQPLARQLFLRLVQVADDMPPTRSSAERSELEKTLGEDARQVLDLFVTERLLTIDADTVQITHEALLAAWPRLRSWIDASTEDLRTRRRISEAARMWAAVGREPDALWRGSLLEAAQDWAAGAGSRELLSATDAAFLDTSIDTERSRRRQRRARVAITTLLMLIVLLVLILLLVSP
jgi:hypothetical protein